MNPLVSEALPREAGPFVPSSRINHGCLCHLVYEAIAPEINTRNVPSQRSHRVVKDDDAICERRVRVLGRRNGHGLLL